MVIPGKHHIVEALQVPFRVPVKHPHTAAAFLALPGLVVSQAEILHRANLIK